MMRFWGHAYRATPDDSTIKDDIGVAPMIGGSGGIAGVPGAWYLSVPASGSKQDAAKEFIAFAYEHNDLSADTSLGLVARKSAFESKADEPGFENYPALLETLEAPADPAPAGDGSVAGDRRHRPRPDAAEGRGAGSRHRALLSDAKSQIEAIIE